MSDPIRELARSGLAPIVNEPGEGPDWDELTGTSIAPAPRQAPGWLVGSVAAVVVFGLIGVSLLMKSPEPVPPVSSPLTTEPVGADFDSRAGAAMGETWWNLVVARDFEAAKAMSHPNANFNFPGLMELVGSEEDVSVRIDPQRFGTVELPQLCFASSNGATGSVVFRHSDGEWLPWEIRANVERCLVADPELPEATPFVSEFDVVEPVPLRVFAVGPNGGADSVIALDEGIVERYERPELLGAYAGSIVDSQRRLIVWTYEPAVRAFLKGYSEPEWTLDASDLSVLREPETGMRGVPTPDGDAIWLITPGLTLGSVSSDTVAALYNMSGSGDPTVISVAGNAFPVGATTTGLIFNTSRYFDSGDGWVTAPGSERVVHVDREGDVRELGPGVAVAVGDDRVVILDCPSERDDSGNCYVPANGVNVQANGLWVGDLEGNRRLVEAPFPGTWIAAGRPSIPSDAMPLATLAPDGSRLVMSLARTLDVNGMAQTSELVMVDLNTGETVTIASFDGETPTATWSLDGRWVVTFLGSSITAIEADNPDNTFTYEDLIPEGQYPLAAG